MYAQSKQDKNTSSKPLDQLQVVPVSSRQMALDALKQLILGENSKRVWTEKDDNLSKLFLDKVVYLAKKEEKKG